MRYCGRLLSALILALCVSGSAAAEGPFTVSPSSITLDGFPGTRRDQRLIIRNNSDQPLTVTIAESTLTGSAGAAASASVTLPPDYHPIIRKLAGKSPGRAVTSPAHPEAAFELAATDTRGDNLLFGVDILDILYQKRTTIIGPVLDLRVRMLCPDNNVAGFLSLDVNQDFGSGIWPAPWQLGPPGRDIGSEFELLVDASGLIADSLGLGNNPIAVILRTIDTSFVYIPIIPTVTRDSVLTITVNGIPYGVLGLNDPDGNLNVGAVFARLELTSAFPDYAPDNGHGIIGTETGVSWVREDPGIVTIPPGDSAAVDVSVLAAKPAGAYNALLRFSAPDQPPVDVPIHMTVSGLGDPAISLNRSGIDDSVLAGSGLTVTLSISNTGTADLFWAIVDTTNTPWISVTPTLGVIQAGMAEDVGVELSSDGLAGGATYSTHFLVGSNDIQTGVISFPVSLTVLPTTGVGEPAGIPAAYALHRNYPNPFNPSTTIMVDLPVASRVDLQVFDLLGRHVSTLIGGTLEPGRHAVPFDGSLLPTGVYICRLETPRVLLAMKIMLVK